MKNAPAISSVQPGYPVSAGELDANDSSAEKAAGPTHPGAAVTWSAVAALGGFLTAFTVSLVGEMPVGELVLMMICGWSALVFAMTRVWPSSLLRGGWFTALMTAQIIALAAYVVSDFYRGSSAHDMARGWGRMVFLAIDVVAIACVFGKNPRNLLFFVFGGLLGEVAAAVLQGPLFGDWWKFGVGVPVTFLVLGLAAQGGVVLAAVSAFALCLLNFAMDFRSVGAMCMVVAAMTAVMACPRVFRTWVIPIGAVLALAAVVFVYQRAQSDRDGNRAGRSDIDRSAMLLAAWEAFETSPFVGHGSWFSNSDVIDNYLFIRDDAAREAGIGGFAGPNEEVEGVALHSQMLVALAEGGIFGAAFFLIYGAGIVWALCDQVLLREWKKQSPVRLLVLVLALFHLWMSPFSGAHRVHIAVAAGLVMLIAWERKKELQQIDEEADEPRANAFEELKETGVRA